MFVFQSMNTVTIAIVATTIVLLLVSMRNNPLLVAGSFVQEIFTNRKYLFHFAAMIAILVFNKIEQMIEDSMTYQTDFTSAVHRLEGDIVPFIQHYFQNDILTYISTFFYVVIFPTLMVVSIGLYTYRKQYTLFYSICYALMFNYMIAIPFYLFFPVNEVWSYHPDVQLLMTNVFPTFETDYRPLSGLDNCFPSLHTSISVSMAVIAMKSNNKFWRWFTLISAVFIIFSIFYLGVHWLTDMGGGLLLGIFASRMALRISEGRSLIGAFMGYEKERHFGK
ncbi:phosphatase PAP2 family protein [Paenibacillus contaminans]|uniref:Inositol phosphorylceramide synthase n=1 Tax=Paenibacillus contaminans TaxID=450362 RepID=A0A329MRH4_9BACL|nr:phosphatase PAP2 family protein [Paenibacillus contaminans]RAV21946.1 inositol phosphorylceramide synthase [Paenibacillus contaminans]